MNTDEHRSGSSPVGPRTGEAGGGPRRRRQPASDILNLCLSVFIFGFFFLACGSEAGPQSENYGNLLASPAGLVVLQEEHPTGWMRPDCFGCHNVNNMHQVNRTGLPDDEVDLPGIRAIIQSGQENSCPMCHGSNGVPQ